MLVHLQLECEIFFRIKTLEFLGWKSGEDPQNIIYDVKKIFEVMRVIGNDRVELESYQRKNIAHI